MIADALEPKIKPYQVFGRFWAEIWLEFKGHLTEWIEEVEEASMHYMMPSKGVIM